MCVWKKCKFREQSVYIKYTLCSILFILQTHTHIYMNKYAEFRQTLYQKTIRMSE